MASTSAAACCQLGGVNFNYRFPDSAGVALISDGLTVRQLLVPSAAKGLLQNRHLNQVENKYRRRRSRRRYGHSLSLNTPAVHAPLASCLMQEHACTLDESKPAEATAGDVSTNSPQCYKQEPFFRSQLSSWPSGSVQPSSNGPGRLQNTLCILAIGQVLLGQLQMPESANAAALQLDAQSDLSVTAPNSHTNQVLSSLSFVDMPKAGSPDVGQTSLFSAENEELAADLFEKLSPSVVSIQDVKVAPAGRSGRGVRSEPVIEGQGSGFIWDSYGHVVTNYHVVAKLATDPSGLQRTTVTVKGKGKAATVFEATLVGADSFRDLAVLKIDPSGTDLQPLPIGTSKDLQVGQSCYAIGNPFGFGQTLTTGIVSGLDRMIPSPSGKPIAGAIQTDAAINAGNSGGPLLDSFGRLIGVNTATFTRQGTGQSSGVNFAVPVDVVYRIVPRLIVYGSLNYENGLKP